MGDYGGDDMRMTAREWTAARIVLIGGFAIAIAVAGYFTWTQHRQAQQLAAAQQAQLQAEAKAEAPPSPAQLAQQQARMALFVCLRVVVNATTNGIVPAYAKLASKTPEPTKVQGRYTCMAATDVAKYTVTADLVCADMRKPDCVKVQSVKLANGTALYRAQD